MDTDATAEVIKFNQDEETTHLIYENCTTIVSSQLSQNKGSSKLTLKNFVNFNWDICYYRGQLIALHISEKFIAYGFTKPDSSEGLVRIVKRETNERALIKGFSSLIEDICFAHLYEIIMLACIDQSGTVYVYVVKEDNSLSQQLRVIPIFQINEDPSYCYTNKHLLSWCQFIPEQIHCLKDFEFESTYKGTILAVVRSSEVEIWHIGIASNFTSGPVFAKSDLNKSLDNNVLNNIKNSVIKLNMEDSDIISVSFSADGSTISLALISGSIYFYKISFENMNEHLKCVFNWHPKEVFLSLRSMVFLDNRKDLDVDVELWKNVVTFSNQNEIILWSCETWKCLQTLKFVQRYNVTNPMKLSVDETGKYIFLNDIDNNFLYVMEVSVDPKSSKNDIKIVSITEISLQSPILSMIIVNTKVDNNDVNCMENSSHSDILDSFDKNTTIINLFAIQPKSIQEGQLTVSSPELIVEEQLMENKKVEHNLFPKIPKFIDLINPINVAEDKKLKDLELAKKNNTITTDPKTLSSIEIHSLVRDKLEKKGVHIDKKSVQNNPLLQNKKKIGCLQEIPVQPSNNHTFAQKTCDLNFVRESSPINNELGSFSYQPKKEFKYNYEHTKAHDDNFESASNYSIEIDKEETSFSGSLIFNNSANSAVKQPLNTSEKLNNNESNNQMSVIFTCLQNINCQIKCLIKRQKKIEDMVKKSSSNKVDTELFKSSLVASLSPTLDTILKDLFISTVIPKFEHACCGMFKQIDASFTERSLEYQNELKSLLNEEGNINSKLEFAFDKFKNDISSIVKHTEKTILNAQNDMHKHFSSLIKEKSLSHVESYVKDPENIANQFMMLSDIISYGDIATAFEKALSASNLELVLHVCGKVSPEEVFQSSNSLQLPIILSLIQQLSCDLSNNTELKYKYLEVAVGSLNYDKFELTHKENINLVLIKLDSNLEKFVLQNVCSHYGRKLKMLQLAVKTIISYHNNSSIN